MTLVGDTTPAPVEGHPFEPRPGQPWGLCVTCGLAAPAHLSGAAYVPPADLPYRCPNCVTQSEKTRFIAPCFHREEATQ